MSRPLRIAVVSNGNAFAAMTLRPLLDAGQVAGIVIVPVPPGRGGTAARLVRIARRTGVRYAGFKAGCTAVPLVAHAVARRPATVAAEARRRGVRLLSARTTADPRAMAFLRELKPDVLLSVSVPERLRPEVLAIPTRAAINIHWAMLPRYGGIAPYLWVLRDGASETGVTVHLMDEGLDTGDVIARRPVPIRPGDTVLRLQLRLAREGAGLLARVMQDLDEALKGAQPQDRGDRSYRSWPGASDVRAARRHGHRLAAPADFAELWRAAGGSSQAPA